MSNSAFFLYKKKREKTVLPREKKRDGEKRFNKSTKIHDVMAKQKHGGLQ
jgi:hypothetical protein